MSGALPITIRPFRPSDYHHLLAIGAANDEPLALPAGSTSDFLAHVARRGRIVVAEASGRIVGFAGAIAITDGSQHLTDLFVAPDLHGRGIGRALLASAFEGFAAPRTTFSSADPRALPMYVRAGMDAHWPLLYLTLDGPALDRLDATAGATPVARAVDWAAAAVLEANFSDCDRAADYPLWAGRAGGAALAVRGGGTDVAVGLAGAAQEVGCTRLVRLVAAPGGDGGAAVIAIVLALAGRRPADGVPSVAPAAVLLAVPGPHPAVRALLDAGARITGRDTFMASDPSLVDPRRVLPDPALR